MDLSQKGDVLSARTAERRETASVPKERADDRILWLRRGSLYDAELRRRRRPLNSGEFDAHPYEQVIDVYRKSGRTNDVVAVLKEKLAAEYTFLAREHFQKSKQWALAFGVALGLAVLALTGNVGAALGWGGALFVVWTCGPWIMHHLFCLCFGYGLNLDRALITIVVCVLIGWPVVESANRGALRTPELPGIAGLPVAIPSIEIIDFSKWSESWAPQVLMLDQKPVQTHVVTASGKLVPTAVLASKSTFPLGGASPAPREIPCGGAINGLVYALDVFLPLVNFHQEEQCRPTEQPWAVGWRWAKAFYALLGWIVISLSIITATGLLRRQSEK